MNVNSFIKPVLAKSFLLVVVSKSFAVFSVAAEEWNERPGTYKLTHDLAKGCIQGDTSLQMTNVGIDFPVLLQRSLDGEDDAVKLLFWVSANIGLDGAGADGYGHYLVEVAKKVGDEKMATIVTAFNNDTKESIEFYLMDHFGSNIPDEKIAGAAESKIMKQFPKLWTQIKSRQNLGK